MSAFEHIDESCSNCLEPNFNRAIAKYSMRYDAVYHLLDIRKSSKRCLLRVVYFDFECKEMISTNALKLEFPSASQEGMQLNRFEIVYVYIDSSINQDHTLRRSDVVLVEMTGSDDMIITNEHILSNVSIANTGLILELYHSFTDSSNAFNLTTLRKIASKKTAVKSVNKIMPNSWNVEEVKRSNFFNESMDKNFTNHVLRIQIYAKTLLLTHEQYSISSVLRTSDHLLKGDILSYLDFLKITNLIINLEQSRQMHCLQNKNIVQNDSDVLYSSLVKLSVISDNLNKKKSTSSFEKRGFKNSSEKKTSTKPTTLVELPNVGLDNDRLSELEYETSSTLFENLSYLYEM